MPNTWLIGIAADGFPLRDGVGSFQLGLQVCMWNSSSGC